MEKFPKKAFVRFRSDGTIMSSHRPYRKALDIGKAIEDIVTNSGILYDKEVVTACVDLIKERPDLLS